MSEHQNPYGYHDVERHEYVITRPDTPTPWINYLGEGKYGGIISNTGGGYSFDRDPRNRRVSRYRYNGIPVDQPGRYIYLRDQESGTYWSPTWQPVTPRQLDQYECRHGSAYTRISSTCQGIHASILYFVPYGGDPCELWVLKVKNLESRPRLLRTFSYAELTFPDAMIDMTNFDWGGHIVFSRYEDGVITTGTKFRPSVTFFSSSATPIGYDTDREAFLGRYHDLSDPRVVVTGIPLNTQAPRGNNIGSLCHELSLAPGEERTIIYILGMIDDQSAIPGILQRYRQPAQVEQAFQSMLENWREYLSHFQVETPDPETNIMLNFWNPVQCRTTLYWSRFISAYESGLGRGMGTRDSAQDTLGTVHALPDHARKTLDMLWRLQFRDGHTWHQVFPLTGEGGVGLAAEKPDWPQWFCDDHLWLVMAVCAYLRETGDYAYLDQHIAYADGDDPRDTVWEHVLRAVNFTFEHRGPRGLPRLGFSDWDDTMNLDFGSGKAESVWCGMQFCRAMLDLADLCQFLGKHSDEAYFITLHHDMAEVIERTSWDGEWYARAYDNNGDPLGVRGEAHQEIALNPQTWAVLGELGSHQHAVQAMESMHQRLNTPYGVHLMTPPYNGSDPRVLGTSTYVPGAKENGGIFCHANTWVIIAAAMLGWNERAYQYYRQILPLARTDADLFLVEPYVYCQNICGPDHPQFGMGRNAWLSGTAAWTYVAGTQWILGIRPTHHGLQVSPVMPEAWPGFNARRIFREVIYDISVKRVGEGNQVTLYVDGKRVPDSVIPLPAPGVNHVIVGVDIGS